jgi:predicted SAM-dependent methyltransferase
MPSFPGGVGLTIGVPSDGKPVAVEWAFALMNNHAPTNYDIRWAFVKGQPVDIARTMIAESAVREKSRYLFFLGTDVTVPPYTIRQLVFHLEHFPKYAVAGAIYCHKSPPQEPLVYRGNGIGPYWDWKVGEVFDVSGIGMDATLIRTSVFEQMPKPWFKTVDTIEPYYEGQNRAEFWTEDLFFCHKLANTCCYKCKRNKDDHWPVYPDGEQTDGEHKSNGKGVEPIQYLCEKDGTEEFDGWKIMADGGLLCQHWDNVNGIPYSLPLSSKPYQAIFQKGSKKIVDLGSGNEDESFHTNEGDVLRVDIRESAKPDYRCDIRKTPFATGHFDVVYSSHTLEHFTKIEVDAVLDEMVRILKEDGELRLVLPNLQWAARKIMNGEIDGDVYNVLYGAQTYQENFHKIGFVPQTIEQLLKAKGFTKFMWAHDRYHMAMRAWKVIPGEIQEMKNVDSFKTVEVGTAQGTPNVMPTVQVSNPEELQDFVVSAREGSVQIKREPKADEQEATNAP